MHDIAFCSQKGGVGKTTLSHLLALGSAWKNKPAYVLHTDDVPPMEISGRPYGFYDGREPNELSVLLRTGVNNDGFRITDAGGSRTAFDIWIAKSMDIMIIPVTPDPEAVDVALMQQPILLDAGANRVMFLLNEVSSNQHERLRDHEQYFSRLPEQDIIGSINRVAAVKRLREKDIDKFPTPPTRVNNLSRQLYRLIEATLVDLKGFAN